MTSYKSGMRSVWNLCKYPCSSCVGNCSPAWHEHLCKRVIKRSKLEKKPWLNAIYPAILLSILWWQAATEHKDDRKDKLPWQKYPVLRGNVFRQRMQRQTVHPSNDTAKCVKQCLFPFSQQREKSYSSRKKTHMVTTLLIAFINVAWE